MNVDWFDQSRFEQEWQADQDVLRQLSSQGDRLVSERNIDVSFRGGQERLVLADKVALARGFQRLQLIELADGEWRLDVSRRQSADEDAIKQLTIIALQIEAACGVVYDGWGCVAQNDRT